MITCRICSKPIHDIYLDLGKTPLANAYLKAGHISAEEPSYELAVAFCTNCYLSQLTTVVPPEIMFDHYLYVSSTTATFRSHCEEFVSSVVNRLSGNVQGELVLDIASNDGCLLSYFKAKGFRTIGVDPAKNLVSEAAGRGIDMIRGYWGRDVADKLLNSQGPVKVVTATNVLAHVHQIHDFLENVNRVLLPDGLFVFEVPYLVDLIEKVEFDTIYHEHLSYFLVSPIREALEQNGLRIIDIEHQSIHGGTIRTYAVKSESMITPSACVQEFIDSERSKGFYDLNIYKGFSQVVLRNRFEMVALLSELKKKGKRVAGYGASAKGNTLLNYYGIDAMTIDYIVDDNPKKHGYLTPGSHIPIVPATHLTSSPPDYLLLLAWNFAEEIKRRTTVYRKQGGKYITPVPRCVCDS